MNSKTLIYKLPRGYLKSEGNIFSGWTTKKSYFLHCTRWSFANIIQYNKMIFFSFRLNNSYAPVCRLIIKSSYWTLMSLLDIRFWTILQLCFNSLFGQNAEIFFYISHIYVSAEKMFFDPQSNNIFHRYLGKIRESILSCITWFNTFDNQKFILKWMNTILIHENFLMENTFHTLSNIYLCIH